MHRLCLLVPDIATTKRIAEHIKTNGISDGHIHVLGKSTLAIEHLHLHQANLLQTTNLSKALLTGGVLGLVVGSLLGLSLALFSPLGMTVPTSGIVIFAFVGLILGLWISGLVGIGVKNPIVEQTSSYIKQGQYLLMIDLSDQEEYIEGEILQRFPLAQVASTTVH